jgi:hypothetical protein
MSTSWRKWRPPTKIKMGMKLRTVTSFESTFRRIGRREHKLDVRAGPTKAFGRPTVNLDLKSCGECTKITNGDAEVTRLGARVRNAVGDQECPSVVVHRTLVESTLGESRPVVGREPLL